MHPSRKLTKFQQCQAFRNTDGRIQQGKRLLSAQQGGISIAVDAVFGSYCPTKDSFEGESEAGGHQSLTSLQTQKRQCTIKNTCLPVCALTHSRPATENNNNANLHFVVL